MYVYRRDDKAKSGTARRGNFELADGNSQCQFEGYITGDDVQIPKDKITEKIVFPTSERFKAAFDAGIEDETNRTAEAYATKLV